MSINEALRLLGLHSRATSAEIKAAYRDYVKIWHPDRHGNDPELRQKAEAKLQEANLAYKVLQAEAHHHPPPPQEDRQWFWENPSGANPYQPAPTRQDAQAQSAIPVSKPVPEVATPVSEPVPLAARPIAEPIRNVSVPVPRPSPKVAIPAPQPVPEIATPAHKYAPEVRSDRSFNAPLWLTGLLAIVVLVPIGFGMKSLFTRGASSTGISSSSASKDSSVTIAAKNSIDHKVDTQSATLAPDEVPAAPAAAPAIAITSYAPMPEKAPHNTVAILNAPAQPKSSLPTSVKSAPPLRGLPTGEAVAERKVPAPADASAVPALSGLSADDRRSVESACSTADTRKSPATYRACVIRDLVEKPRPIHLN